MKIIIKKIICSLIISIFLSSCIYTSNDMKSKNDEVVYLQIKLDMVKDDYNKFYQDHKGSGDIVNYQYFSQIFVPPIMYLPILNYLKPTMVDTAAASVGFILNIKYTWVQSILFFLLFFFYWGTPVIILILIFYIFPNYIKFIIQEKKYLEYKTIVEKDLPLQREELLKFRQIKKQNDISLSANMEKSIHEARKIEEYAQNTKKKIILAAQQEEKNLIDEANQEHGTIILEAKKEAAAIISKASLKNVDIKN